MLARSLRFPSIPVAVIPLLLCAFTVELPAQSAKQGAKAPARRGTALQIDAARAAFVDGVDRISRNPSAFFQGVVKGSGCTVTMRSTRPEKADSLRESHAFDAGHLTAKSRMSILPSGGVIQLTYPTVASLTVVSRERVQVSNGVSGAPAVEHVSEVAVLAAETSQQPDVVAFIKGLTDLVRVCGGSIEQ